MTTRKLVYIGPAQGGVDIPAAHIVAWKPGEIRELPENLAEELLGREGQFVEADAE